MKRLGLGPTQQLSVLVVVDDPSAREDLTRAFAKAELNVRQIHRTTEAALDGCSELKLDVAIVAAMNAESLAFADRLRTELPLVPVVLWIASEDDSLASTIMEAAGAEYVTMSSLSPIALMHALRYALGYAQGKRVELEAKKVLEEQSAQLQRSLADARAAMRSSDELLAIVSHDLRSPLNILSMGLSMIQDDFGDHATAGPLIQKMRRGVTRMNRLIEDLLDASRIDAATMSVEATPVRAHTLVDAAVETEGLLARSKGVSLEPGMVDHACKVWADRDRIAQVFSNLIGNAVKFTPQGGKITLEVRPHASDAFVSFHVRDSGAGIPEELLPHVFKRFWKELGHTRDGAGLGLYIADGIIRAHGGGMAVTSSRGDGSDFSFWLRRVD